MALESATYISELVNTNPPSGDQVSQGDDHLRLLKAVLLSSFPGISGAVTLTHTQINALQTDLDTVEAAYVKKDGTVAFTGEVAGITPTASASLATKGYVNSEDDLIDAAVALKADKTITVTGANSVTGGGDLSANRTLSLSGDAASPGNDKYYGTDSGGTKGFFALPVLSIGTFTSTAQTLANGATTSYTHSLGAAPDIVNIWARCTTAESGYSIGDEVQLPGTTGNQVSDSDVVWCTIERTSTQVKVHAHSSREPCVINKSTFAFEEISYANWEFYISAFKF